MTCVVFMGNRLATRPVCALWVADIVLDNLFEILGLRCNRACEVTLDPHALHVRSSCFHRGHLLRYRLRVTEF